MIINNQKLCYRLYGQIGDRKMKNTLVKDKNIELLRIKDLINTAADALNIYPECSHITGTLLFAMELLDGYQKEFNNDETIIFSEQ